MNDAKYIGRIGGLAVALGIGAGIVAMPSVAYAKPAGDRSDTTSASESSDKPSGNDNIRRATESLSNLVKPRQGSTSATAGAKAAAEAPARSRISVSINGMNLAGTSAESTKGSAAVVYGAKSTAVASGRGSLAVVVGDSSTASARGGTGNRAVVRGDGSQAYAEIGDRNTATVRGNVSGAAAGGGTGNTATAIGDSSYAIAGMDRRAAAEEQARDSGKMEPSAPNRNYNTATAINTGEIIGGGGNPEPENRRARAGIYASAGISENSSNNTATIRNTGEIDGSVEAWAGRGLDSTDNVAVVENTGTITGDLLIAVGAAENNKNNIATVKNSGIIKNEGDFRIIAGGGDSSTNNRVTFDNSSDITIFGAASMFVVADEGTPTNPDVEDFVNDTPLIVDNGTTE